MRSTAMALVVWLCGTVLACADAPRFDGRLSMQEAIHMAVAQRPELAAAEADVAMQDAELGAQRAQLRPQASLSTFGVSQNSGMIYTTTPHVSPTFYSALPAGTLLDVDVMGMLPLYTGGRLQQQVAGALVATHIAQAQQEGQVRDIERQVRLQYLMVLETQDEVRIHQDAVDQENEAVRLAHLQFDTGKAAAITLYRANAAQADEVQQKNDAQARLDSALVDLRWALGLSQASAVEVTPGLPEVTPPPDLPAVTALALRMRPDLRVARLQVLQADAQLAAAGAPAHPEVYLVGYGQSTTVSGHGPVGGTSVGVTASLPVADGGLRKSQVDAALANRDKQRALAEATTQAVERDVQKAYVALRTQYANIDLSQAALQAAAENYRIARLRFNLGASIQLEILDAVVTLERAQLNRLKALYAYHRAQADLEWSAGQ